MVCVSQNIDLLMGLILSLGGIAAGLSALNLNLMSILKLHPFTVFFKYICGVAGLYAGYCIVTNYQVMKAEGNLGLTLAIILTLANIGIGISGLGTNILRALHMEPLQKAFQLIAGATGVYALILIIKSMPN